MFSSKFFVINKEWITKTCIIFIFLVLALIIFITFIFSATAELGGLAGFGIAPFSISLALGLTMLELLVAVIQAYVFALLTAVFIGMAIHVDH